MSEQIPNLKLYKILTGDWSKKLMQYISFGSISITVLCLIIARIFYPISDHYSIFTHTLSYLGDYSRNPRGWFFFSIAMFTMGLSFIGMIFYIHRRIYKIFPIMTWIGTILLEIGAICTILVGFFPDAFGDDFIEDLSMGRVHNIVSSITFFAILSGLIIYGLLFIVDYYPKCQRLDHELFPTVTTLPYFLTMAIAGFGMLISIISRNIFNFEFPGPELLSFTFWEWMLSLSYCIIIYRLTLVLPNDLSKIK
ncbi:MAG: DUF998 domain-containing protein [Promethearchaeota archaeon]